VVAPSPPSITKSFGVASMPLNGSTSLTFTINNPNAAASLTGVAFTDTLPAGLVIATPNGLSNTCGGTVTATGGASALSLSGGTLAGSASCTVATNVTGTTAGIKNNSVTIASTEGGTGNTSNASITVVAPPTITKAFGAASIALNGTTSLNITVQNNNTTTLTGIAFTDTFPAGLVVSTLTELSNSCAQGIFAATAGASTINLSAATLGAGASCTYSVNVTGATTGVKNNVTSTITSNESGDGGTASASIDVVAPPTISKAFGAVAIAVNEATSLTFTLVNPNTSDALTGVGFTDPLPAGLVVGSPNGLTGSCGGGTITAVAGSSSVSLSGATLPADSSCTFSVNVLGTAGGTVSNITGAVTSNEGGTGGTASASLTVAVLIPVPSLDRWALLLLVLALATIGVHLRYRRTRVR